MSNLKNRLARVEKDLQPGRPSYEEYQAATHRMSARTPHILLAVFPEVLGHPLPPPVPNDSPELRARDNDIIVRYQGPHFKREVRENAEQVRRKLLPELYDKPGVQV